MDIVGTAPPAEPGHSVTDRRPGALAAILSGESLAVAAFTVGLTTLLGSSWLSTSIVGEYAFGLSSPRDHLQQQAVLYGAAGVLVLAGGVAALHRRRPAGPVWVQALAGAASILALVLLAIAALSALSATMVAESVGSGNFTP
jgi:nitrate reductase gamma subunit